MKLTPSVSAQLLELGASSSVDIAKLSPSTIQSLISHIKTLKRNNIEISEQALTTNTEFMLDNLVDKKGARLKDMYKRQIGMTIKRLYPNANLSFIQYNEARRDVRRSRTRAASEEFMNSIRKVRDATLNVFHNIYVHNQINDLGMYDASLAVILILSTSLRIEEARQLKMIHIDKIKRNEPIGIKSKGTNQTRIIAPNTLLLTLFTTIEKQRPLVEHKIKTQSTDSNRLKQTIRLSNGYILISSVDFMRKKLHELAASISVNFETLGFTVFRKLTTTILVDGGAPFVAQTMNNHSSLNTTLEHYNMKTSKAAQDTYNDLFEFIQSIETKPHNDDDDNTNDNVESDHFKVPLQTKHIPSKPSTSSTRPAPSSSQPQQQQQQQQSQSNFEGFQQQQLDKLEQSIISQVIQMQQRNEESKKIEQLSQELQSKINELGDDRARVVDLLTKSNQLNESRDREFAKQSSQFISSFNELKQTISAEQSNDSLINSRINELSQQLDTLRDRMNHYSEGTLRKGEQQQQQQQQQQQPSSSQATTSKQKRPISSDVSDLSSNDEPTRKVMVVQPTPETPPQTPYDSSRMDDGDYDF